MASHPDGRPTTDTVTAAAWRAVVDALGYGTCVVDASGMVVHANAEAVHLLEVDPVGRRLWDAVRIVAQPGSDTGAVLAPLGRDDVRATVTHGRSHRRDDVLVIVPGGRAFPGRCVLAPASLPDGSTVAVLSFLDDTGRREFVEALEHLAAHDALTGLPNRMLLLERLDQAVARAGRTGAALAVLFCDLDGFKSVNDLHGHAAGDDLLVEAGQRLRRSVRPADTVARLGGDEFVVLCEDLADAEAARVLAARIVDALERPFGLRGVGDVSLSASIGIALATGSGDAGEDLLRAADAAMYQAKESGSGRVALAADARVEGVP